jgi:hypothetical protein
MKQANLVAHCSQTSLMETKTWKQTSSMNWKKTEQVPRLTCKVFFFFFFFFLIFLMPFSGVGFFLFTYGSFLDILWDSLGGGSV